MNTIQQKTRDFLESQMGNSAQALLGLDGFVDQIIRVVDHIDASGADSYIPSITELSQRIAKAAGKSTAMELECQLVKLGGNGPIMANALMNMDFQMTYIGSIGDGADGVHHIFEDLAKQADCYVLCEAARTDALEFNDGKLMLQHLKCLDKVNYPRLLEVIGEEKLIALFREADLVALNHWSSLIHMTDIWCQLQKHICPKLDAGKRRIFFDLADPEKREPVDIIAALECLADFSKWYDVSLGLNEKEAEHICEISGSNITNSDPKELALERASYIHKNLNIDCVTIHPRAFAAAVNQDTEAVVDGPFIEKPKISTGAGDHFNAGFSLAQTLGADLDVALQCGVATSGYYVRNAISPNRQQLKEFIETLN